MIGGPAVAQRHWYRRLAGVVTAVAVMAAGELAHAGPPAFPSEPTRLGDGASPGIVHVKTGVAVRLPRPRPGEGTEPSETAVTDAAAPALESADNAAMPRPRPEISAAEVAKYLANTHFGFMPDAALKAAIEAIQSKRYAEARAYVADHADPLAIELVAWLIAREPDSGLSAAEIIAILKRRPDWPEPERLRLRAEQAFHALGPDSKAVLTFYRETEPRSIGGRMALAGALRAAGREDEAIPIVRDLWRDETLTTTQAAAMLARFGSVLTRDDHIYRFRRVVLNRRSSDALTQAQLLGSGYADLARAVIAVLDRSSKGKRLLDGVAKRFSSDPLYVFAKARLLRRTGEPIKAARLLVPSAPETKLAGDADIWWDERRDLSRALLDKRAFDLAYQVVAGNRAVGEGERTEAAFHAGWYALRFLRKPDLAEPHFQELLKLATLPRTHARASYWLGRTFEAQEKQAAARLAYGEAARFGGTFYGQLAREKLGLATTGLERLPEPAATDRLRFAARDHVQAIRLLTAAGRGELAYPFFRGLAELVETPGEAALMTALARRIGLPRAGTQAAAIAEQRGLAVASLPAPFVGVPPDLPLPTTVDRALVYAIVRQESAFNHQATSHAGARGLMQLMPATARATARNAGLPYSVQRLTSDPLYNATLGAEHLGELLDRLNHSYVLTFVAYNAGPGRSRDWVLAYGDPRGGVVDPIEPVQPAPRRRSR